MQPFYANRGRSLEELVQMANRRYRNRKLAVIHKVPTGWVPIRDHATGKIAGAKVERKAAVDFLGVYKGWPVAFDAKETSADHIRWDRLKEHQREFLECWHLAGGIGFVLVGFMVEGRFFVVPWPVWRRGHERWRRENGEASVSCAQLADWGYEVASPLEYLTVVDRIWG